MTRKKEPQGAGWRAPTRRAFVGMVAAAAAALAAKGPAPRVLEAMREAEQAAEQAAEEDARPRSTWSGTTRWIGHC